MHWQHIEKHQKLNSFVFVCLRLNLDNDNIIGLRFKPKEHIHGVLHTIKHINLINYHHYNFSCIFSSLLRLSPSITYTEICVIHKVKVVICRENKSASLLVIIVGSDSVRPKPLSFSHQLLFFGHLATHQLLLKNNQQVRHSKAYHVQVSNLMIISFFHSFFFKQKLMFCLIHTANELFLKTTSRHSPQAPLVLSPLWRGQAASGRGRSLLYAL